MTDINEIIARRLRALRLSKKMSVDEMAKVMGVKSHTVTRIENSKSTISVQMLVAAAQALDVLVSVVVGELPANGSQEADNG